jgi:hypothetical protein
VRLVFDRNTLQQGKGVSRSITGVVYFELSPDRQFPCAGWSDFVVVVANWWRAALEQINRGAPADLLFMDGPYQINVVPDGKGLLLRCVERRLQGPHLLHEAVVQTDDFKRELLTFAHNVSVACRDAGIESMDLDELRKHRSALWLVLPVTDRG